MGTEEAIHKLWKRVAYATRYGHAGLEDVLHMPQEHLQGYLEALNEIVGEENRKPSR